VVLNRELVPRRAIALRWKIWNATDFELNADVVTLYGEQFVETLSQPPRSAFVADGSPITIHRRELV
jgi:hypothetical protein